tara:strand:+ start:7154 stop:8023 length:870 start_codon:yes stop_codon:yes gene_type:complete
MIYKRLLSILLVSVLGIGSAYGHQGEMKFMFQFPDHLVPTLDGDMSDWDIVGESYQINGENMFNQFGAPMDLSDFNAKLMWGYNLNTNKAYYGAWISDDAINDTEKWSTTTDWDHSGGVFRGFDQGDDFDKRWASAQAQRYDVAAPVFSSSGYYTRIIDGSKAWAGQDPYLMWGGAFLRGDVNTFEPAEMFTEYAMVPFDDIHPDGPDASIEHKFAEGQIVGIEVNWGDKDADPGSYDDAYWSGFGGVGASKDADQFGDYLLAPIEPDLPKAATAVEASTWGQIKTSLD